MRKNTLFTFIKALRNLNYTKILLLFLFFTASLSAQNWNEIIKASASDGANVDYFGYSVAISGDVAIVGAYAEDPNGIGNAGAAYIFERNSSGTWVEEQKIVASDGAQSDVFGRSVAISGDVAIVGAYRDNNIAGSAYIFSANNANTTPTDITLSASAIDENVATATTVGSFSTTDADTTDTHTYSLVAGTGDTNNASFTIDGADLKTNAAIDYETNTTLSIRVQTNDGTATFEKEITITVNDLDDTPPTVVTQDITVQLDADGNASIVAADIDNGSSDVSGNVTLSLGASSLQAGFNDATLDNGFELVNGADWVSGIAGSGNLNAEFVAKKTSSGRNYLRTVASDFINSDFEVTFTYDDSNVGGGGDMLTFLGIGDPSVTEGLFSEPDMGIFLRDHSNQNGSA
ncbi:MAG: hypothetical protein P8P88_01230, partial [Polaribacter sp.]|nr:hypothetical protein [Polaribacter sp.]